MTMTDRWLNVRRLSTRWALRLSWFMLPFGLAFSAAEAAPPNAVSWQLVREPGGPIDGPQRWLRFLEQTSPRTVRVRNLQPGDQPAVQPGLAGASSFEVTAVITRNNQLRVPGRNLRLGDLGALEAWIGSLTVDRGMSQEHAAGQPNPAAANESRQRQQLRQLLAAPITQTTRGQPRADVFRHLQRQIPKSLSLSGQARAILGDETPVEDEYQGLSAGTALAALLSVSGLQLVPQPTARGDVLLRIRGQRTSAEAWPIGWPSEQPDHQTLPKLLDRLPVEIREMPVTRVLDALQPRLNCPLVIDRQAISRGQLDLNHPVSFQAERTFYKRVLEQVLFQARLQLQVRQDDAGRPFLWVSPLTP